MTVDEGRFNLEIRFGEEYSDLEDLRQNHPFVTSNPEYVDEATWHAWQEDFEKRALELSGRPPQKLPEPPEQTWLDDVADAISRARRAGNPI